MNAYQTAEEKGRELFKTWCDSREAIESVTFTEGNYDRADALVKNKFGDEFIVEIKARREASNKYNDWILECDKEQALLKIKNENNYKGCLYVNFFSDGKIAVWLIEHPNVIETKPINKSCRKTTATNSGYVLKLVKQLKLSDAIIVESI